MTESRETASGLKYLLHLEDPRVLSVNADIAAEVESETSWTVTVFDPEEGIATLEHRVVTANLALHTKEGSVHVMLGGLFSPLPADFGSLEDVKEAVKVSVALETLYDMARSAARTVGAITGVPVETPVKSPDPEIAHLSELSPGPTDAD